MLTSGFFKVALFTLSMTLSSRGPVEGIDYNIERKTTEKHEHVLRIHNKTERRLFCTLTDGEFSITIWVFKDGISSWYLVYSENHKVTCR